VSILVMLATAGAVVALLAGARRHSGPVARGYRWLAAAASFWFAGLIVTQVLPGPLSASPGLADVAPLLALATAAAGVMVLAEGEKRNDTGSVLPGLADGYVMAVALLVIGWVVAFSGEFHRSNEGPRTFLLDLMHPLADLAVLGVLLPVLTIAWRRVAVPYLALLTLTFADSLGVGARLAGWHQGILEQLAVIAAAILLGAAPWVESIAAQLDLSSWGQGTARSPDGTLSSLLGRRSPVTNAGAATIIASVAVVVAAFVVIVNGLASAPASGLALVIAGGAAVLVIAVRILMLVRENGLAIRMWSEASNSLRDLADRTGDMVLICDLDGTIGYASPLVSAFSYSREALVGKTLGEFVHPEDAGAARAAVAAVVGIPEDAALTPAALDAAYDAAGYPAPGRDPDETEQDGEKANDGRFSCRVRAADGTWRHVECAVLLYRLPGEPARLLLSVRDVSDQVALRQQVTHLTFHDGLTGLPNRAYVEERARAALEPTDDRQAAVIFLDLDGFTAVNDLIGHGAGDLVIAQAARRLRAVAPAQETVARWGGDEFAVLLEKARRSSSSPSGWWASSRASRSGWVTGTSG
jgi:PAS domain-containing protein